MIWVNRTNDGIATASRGGPLGRNTSQFLRGLFKIRHGFAKIRPANRK
jgi:hypothetical protein